MQSLDASHSRLPIDDVLPQALRLLRSHASLVLRAPAGAGKTTRLPPALLSAGLTGQRQLIMLEPRRLATRTAARRIADEQGWTLGDEVGYRIRFEHRASDTTRLLIITEGVLVQMLQSDPFLETFGIVVFDEFHERNLSSDLALAMVRRLQQEARPDLKIVVMSATLDPQPIRQFLGSCPAVESTGRLFPVTVRYLERPDPRPLPVRVAVGVEALVNDTDGDLLAFLPGVGEIHRAAKLLAPLAAKRDLRVLKLYGDLSSQRQDAVLAPCEDRKIVLATNVAESSLTVGGITGVVDSGYARVLRFDPAIGLNALVLTRISRSAAEQRAGRAGRLGPGCCLRLWTEHDDRSLPPRETPEIQRVDLAGPALQLLAWGESELQSFGWFEAPPTATLQRALELLRDLGAVDRAGLTHLGQTLARLPLHPRLARLLVAGHCAGQTRRAARMAALLSERDLVHRAPQDRPVVAATVARSDLLDRLEAIEQFAQSGDGETALGPVRRDRARQVLRVSEQLEKLAHYLLDAPAAEPLPKDSAAAEALGENALLRAVLQAYPDRLARRRRPQSQRALMVGGRGVRLSAASVVQAAEFFCCLELDASSNDRHGEALVRQASTVERGWLDTLAPSVEVFFDAERQRVVGQRRTLYRDLVLDEVECDPGEEACQATLIAAAAEHLEQALALDEPGIRQFLARLRSLAAWCPELDLPTFDAYQLRDLLPVLCAGKRSFAELQRAPLLDILKGALGFEHRRRLDRLAPERITVPSGSQIQLRYEPGEPPVLAVRIQELFGLAETPQIAGDRIPVLLHLLAPNMRPQQITQDLRSFWETTYPEVRKELQGRYPRHAWPADPTRTKPERHPPSRRQGGPH